MNRPEIHFASNHSSGNVFWIMGAVRDALRKQRRISEWNDLYQEVQNCGSYVEALRLMNEHVHLIDDDGLYVLQKGI